MNFDCVYQGAKDAGLSIVDVWPVMGGGSKKKKKSNLFSVYVMKKKKSDEDIAACNKNGNGEGGYNNNVVLEEGNKANIVRPSLIFRDEHGKWTKELQR